MSEYEVVEVTDPSQWEGYLKKNYEIHFEGKKAHTLANKESAELFCALLNINNKVLCELKKLNLIEIVEPKDPEFLRIHYEKMIVDGIELNYGDIVVQGEEKHRFIRWLDSHRSKTK